MHAVAAELGLDNVDPAAKMRASVFDIARDVVAAELGAVGHGKRYHLASTAPKSVAHPACVVGDAAAGAVRGAELEDLHG
jgi:hypothetical protein